MLQSVFISAFRDFMFYSQIASLNIFRFDLIFLSFRMLSHCWMLDDGRGVGPIISTAAIISKSLLLK